jgi:hypothetical protein
MSREREDKALSKEFELISEIEATAAFASEAMRALDLLIDELECDVRSTDEHEEVRAIVCFRRFPSFLAALRTVCRDLDRQLDDINSAIEATYKHRRAG